MLFLESPVLGFVVEKMLQELLEFVSVFCSLVLNSTLELEKYLALISVVAQLVVKLGYLVVWEDSQLKPFSNHLLPVMGPSKNQHLLRLFFLDYVVFWSFFLKMDSQDWASMSVVQDSPDLVIRVLMTLVQESLGSLV